MQKESPQLQKRLHFKNPPIVEAVIAFGISMLPEAALSDLRACAEMMKSLGYSQLEPVIQHQVQIRFENGASSSDGGKGSQLGLKFKSDDGLHAVQFNLNGFIFSRLGKYQSWEQFRDEAKKIWSIYSLGLANPQIAGLGVRYINKLFIPVNDMVEDYVTVSPNLPSGLNQRIETMFMQLGLPILDPEGKLIHTQIILPTEKEGFATLLLDNDFQFLITPKAADQVWQLLEGVRAIKDEYFERFTTSKMRETFDA